jgi:hypothetical protein
MEMLNLLEYLKKKPWKHYGLADYNGGMSPLDQPRLAIRREGPKRQLPNTQ